MTDWRDEVESALSAFTTVAVLAGDSISRDEIEVEYLSAPHRPPTHLPANRMAVYGSRGDVTWLKIGKAGSNSSIRYTRQHSNPGSVQSILAGLVANDPRMLTAESHDPETPGAWIKTTEHRINILYAIPEAKRASGATGGIPSLEIKTSL